MSVYQKGQNLKLTFKDRLEDPTNWNAFVQVDLESVTDAQIEGYFENSFLVNVEIVSEDYSDTPLSKTHKIYK